MFSGSSSYILGATSLGSETGIPLGMALAEVENMAALQLFNLGGCGGMLLQEILIISGVLRHILVHSEAYREVHITS